MNQVFATDSVCFSEVSRIAERLGIPHADGQRYIESDNVERYTEVDAGRGSMGRFCGAKLMPLLLNLAKREKL